MGFDGAGRVLAAPADAAVRVTGLGLYFIYKVVAQFNYLWKAIPVPSGDDARHGAYNLGDLRLRMGNPEAAAQIAREMLRLSALRHTPGQIKFLFLLTALWTIKGRHTRRSLEAKRQ